MKVKLLMILFFVMGILGQGFSQFTSTGKVMDSNGEALIGVAIAIKGTVLGTNTDIDGQYSLVISDPNATLIFSYLGYSDVEQVVDATTGNLTITGAGICSVQ